MPLVDLNKIVLRKQVEGVACPSCGGDLEAVPTIARPSFWRRLLPWPLLRLHNFQCQTCLRRYQLSEIGADA